MQSKKNKSYKEKYRKKYKKYRNGKIFKRYNLKNKNTFHGKSKIKLSILTERASYELETDFTVDKKEKILFLGCVLHSIQDYSAHSYGGDLETFKKGLNKNHGKVDYNNYNQEECEYHRDWLTKEKKKRKKLHKKYKDNPKQDFTYNHNPGVWEWKEVESKWKNQRYIDALNNSVSYIRDVGGKLFK